jgi:A/G-specific adenine glycosylase
MNKQQQRFFTQQLLQWHINDNARSLPWKDQRDPYKIWLSEIILQQTRAAQALPYYNSFITKYPTVKDLANAADDDVFRLWQGLGYYNRCRNLLAAARVVAYEHNGVFPNTYEAILALKGIGTYTAAAIASFAFQLPYAVLDGNVYRVLSRYFGITTPIDTAAAKKEFQSLASCLIDQEQPAAFNQAIMDMGAVVCKPKNPLCHQCSLQPRCFAYKNNSVHLLPIKSKKLQIKPRTFHFIWMLYGNEGYIEQRTDKDIWQNLYQPYVFETIDEPIAQNERYKQLLKYTNTVEDEIVTLSQKLTHQKITAHFHTCYMKEKPVFLKDGLWVPIKKLKKFAFPRTIVSFLNIKKYF